MISCKIYNTIMLTIISYINIVFLSYPNLTFVSVNYTKQYFRKVFGIFCEKKKTIVVEYSNTICSAQVLLFFVVVVGIRIFILNTFKKYFTGVWSSVYVYRYAQGYYFQQCGVVGEKIRNYKIPINNKLDLHCASRVRTKPPSSFSGMFNEMKIIELFFSFFFLYLFRIYRIASIKKKKI